MTSTKVLNRRKYKDSKNSKKCKCPTPHNVRQEYIENQWLHYCVETGELQ